MPGSLVTLGFGPYPDTTVAAAAAPAVAVSGPTLASGLPLGLDEDWKSWDNIEVVKFGSARKKPGDSADQDMLTAKRRAVTTRQILQSNGAYTEADVNFFMPEILLATGSRFTPKPGDVLTDTRDITWTVLEVVAGKLGRTWKCVARDLILAFALRDKIDIERASPAGTAPRVWTKLYRSLACRMHPQSADVAEERGVKGQTVKYLIPVARQLDLLNVRECRVVWVKDRRTLYLDIESYRDAEQIAVLPTIEAVLKP